MSKVSDNVELDFPARMNDGRQFTDYRPNCYLNNELGQGMGSWQYRAFLTDNAGGIHDKMLSGLELELACSTCTGAPVPEVKTVMDCTHQNICHYNMKDPKGLGQGRNYNVGGSSV
tara:strand:- start:277 stop:624 length:348 start_codon:yes stop_codon:yes gene_type:complete